MTGLPLALLFLATIVLMIIAIAKWNIHPFLSIMGVSLLLALLAGIPPTEIADLIGDGFSKTFHSIGIVIILGSLIGAVLEQTGAALKLADLVVRLVGRKNPELAIELMGWVISIPVFCDSGFVILNPIRLALAQRTGASSVSMTMALSAGLYISHVLIPPTPGPIAAANTLGIGNQLLLIIGLGLLCSVAPLTVGLIFAKQIGKHIQTQEEQDGSDKTVQTYEDLVSSYGNLPGGFNALAPLLIPILFLAAGTFAEMLPLPQTTIDLFSFLGNPVIALTAGTIAAVFQLASVKKLNCFYALTNDTLKTAGPILFVTAAGGVLGTVISATSMMDFILQNAGFLMNLGIFFPFLLAAILKTAQGSSTVAITTTAGILAPMLPALGLDTPLRSALTVLAIGAGAMTVSHANDSYFWVVTNFGKLTPQQGYQTQTLLSLLMGTGSILFIFLFTFFV